MPPLIPRAAAVLRRLPAKDPNVAEIGVLAATLSLCLLQQRDDLFLVGVDSWVDASGHSDAYKATGDPHSNQTIGQATRAHAAAVLKLGRYKRRVKLLWMPSLEAADQIANGTLDLVFIDADHSYQGVSADIAAWKTKIVPGGYIGGHDYNHP